jgi:hypothetical protein
LNQLALHFRARGHIDDFEYAQQSGMVRTCVSSPDKKQGFIKEVLQAQPSADALAQREFVDGHWVNPTSCMRNSAQELEWEEILQD